MTESYLSKAAAAMRVDATGVHYWVKGQPATKEEYARATWYAGTPVWDSIVTDFGICLNCHCTDCGCCVGCGAVDADLEGGHGYACVM